MCLVTLQQKPIYTKKDITVYKVIRISITNEIKCYFSCMSANFRWFPNMVFKTDFGITKLEQIKDNTIFFDYVATSYYRNLSEEYINKVPFICIGKGFHASLTKRRLNELYLDCRDGNYYEDICKFIIPDGSYIFKDKTGLIVSNQMMLIE